MMKRNNTYYTEEQILEYIRVLIRCCAKVNNGVTPSQYSQWKKQRKPETLVYAESIPGENNLQGENNLKVK